MRAIYILLILLIINLYGCATVEIAKEVTKASNSLKTTIQKISNDQNDQDDEEKITIDQDDSGEVEDFIKEKEEIIVAKKKEKAVISKQKEIAAIKIKGKTLDQLTKDFGKPDLIRKDGNTKAVRFNTSRCRFFIFFNLEAKKLKAEYYEIRNTRGELVDKKEKINKCFKEIQKT